MTYLTDSQLTYYWLGPVGKLRQLPLLPVAGSTDATEESIGALLTSLTGTGTLDTLGHKRTWRLDWVCLTTEEAAATHAWFLRLTRSPIRLVDTRAGNRLTRDGSAAGAYSRSTTSHTVTAGSTTFVGVIDYPVTYDGLVDSGVQWSVPVSTAATMRVDATDLIPLIPGEQISVTIALKGSGSTQVGVQYYDINGATAGTSLASSVALGAWADYTHTFTPSVSQVAAALIVVAASGSARDITVGPALWHPTNTDWVPGTGCPRVLPLTRATTYLGLANQDISLTLRER